MANFTDEQKKFVVTGWAQFRTSDEIATAFVEHFQEEGADVTRPTTAQLARYNPEFAAGKTLSADLLKLFRAARKAFEEDLTGIAIAYTPFRVRELLELYRRQKARKSDVIAAQLLEQAAKELGGMYRQAKATPEQVAAYAEELTDRFIEQIKDHVTNPQEQTKLIAAARGGLAKRSG